MYNPDLDTFQAVAATGSFSQAAKLLFISHTAVIKKINQLEKRLGVALFRRSHHGVVLTEAGQAFHREAAKIIKCSDEAVKRIREAFCLPPKTIRIGNSTLYPCRPFMELWDKLGSRCPGYQLEVVPFVNDSKHLDESFDILIGAYDKQQDDKNISFIPVGKYRFCLAVPIEHRLAEKKRLCLRDLAGETLQIMYEGQSAANDAIRRAIQENYPEIRLKNIPPLYNVNTFNRCAEGTDILLSLECWKDVHPALVSVPLIEEFYCPYGIIASPHPAKQVKEFLDLINQYIY